MSFQQGLLQLLLNALAIRFTTFPIMSEFPIRAVTFPPTPGVCTDEVIRIYRAVGVDLQKEVYEDMVHNFDAYPHRWQQRPDTNIDHRRVPNLMVFFARKGTALPISLSPVDYSPGDIVAWDLGGGVTHIGVVVDKRGPSSNYMIVHNIGYGTKMEDRLFGWKIIGHYRYHGPVA